MRSLSIFLSQLKIQNKLSKIIQQQQKQKQITVVDYKSKMNKNLRKEIAIQFRHRNKISRTRNPNNLPN